MSVLNRIAVATRRHLVRRPWVYWFVVVVAALGAAAAVSDHAARVDAARSAWGEEATVHVATRRLVPGDPLATEPHVVPAAVAPAGAIDDPAGLSARQHVAVGEIVHDVDVIATVGPLALTPDGWLVVPVVESPPSGAVTGDHVRVVAEAVVISAEAVVVGHHDDATLVAVPADRAPIVAAAGDVLTLLLVP